MVTVDITAGNRHIYGGRLHSECNPDLDEVIYLDIEYKLKKPPTIFADNTRLPFRDNVIDEYIYDPPYWFHGDGKWHGDPTEQMGSFWGNFKNLGNLNRLLRGAAKETRRTLRMGGVIFIKWCDGAKAWDNNRGKCRPWVFWTWCFKELSREEWRSRSGRSKNITRWLKFIRVV